MVDRAKLLERLLVTFVDELDEHVETLNEGVLALEKGLSETDSQETLTNLFRAAHSLKGASRAVDQPAVEQLCHVLEDVFGGIRDGRLKPAPALCTLMLKTADTIAAAGQCLRAKTPVNAEQLDEHRRAMMSAAAGEEFEMPTVPDPSPEQPTTDPDVRTPPSTAILSTEIRSGEDTEASARSDSDESDWMTATPDSIVTPASSSGTSEPVPPARPRAAPAVSPASSTVRVAQEKLDLLLAQTGELLVARQRIDTHPVEVESLLDSVTEWKNEWNSIQQTLIRLIEGNGADPLVARSPQYAARLVRTVEGAGERLRSLEKSLEQLRRKTLSDARQLNVAGGSVQDEVHHIRMVPFEEACGGLERVVRDISSTTGKDVQLVVEGGDIEVDRSVITGLADPLLHLVRNAVDHGIETRDRRRAAGKAPVAKVTVSASLRGSQVQVIVSDDGQGLDLERIRNRVRTRGLPEPSDDRELVNCIFLPGFSTAEMITDVSGRGVGMDVAKSQVEKLRGTIHVATQQGLGTRFTMLVPLTLTTIDAVFVSLTGQPFLLPSSSVRKLVRFLPSEIRSIQGQNTLPLGNAPIPVVSLGDLLGGDSGSTPSESGRLTGVIATAGGREAVLVVDEVNNEREVVVKNLGPRIHRVPHISGATLLQSGEIALLLNVPSLIQAVAAGGRSLSVLPASSASNAAPVAQRVLVVDDSMTTRTLIRSILESAGYDVEAAVDGQDAWDRMQVSQARFDLVVSDVDMPRMDGFRLTEAIRASTRYEDMPVVLVTARDTEDDKVQGVRAGASAYLVKSEFDQSNILDTIQQLI